MNVPNHTEAEPKSQPNTPAAVKNSKKSVQPDAPAIGNRMAWVIAVLLALVLIWIFGDDWMRMDEIR